MLLTSIHLEPKKVDVIVLAICTLHNFLKKNSSRYITAGSFDCEDPETHKLQQNGAWREEINDLDAVIARVQSTVTKNAICAAKSVRDKYCEFYNSARGSVPWQEEMLKRGKA